MVKNYYEKTGMYLCRFFLFENERNADHRDMQEKS